MGMCGPGLVGICLIVTVLTGCESLFDSPGEVVELSDVIENVDSGAGVDEVLEANKTDHDTKDPVTFNESDAKLIQLSGQTVQENADGVSFRDQVLTIGASGIYRLSGTIEDGQILIDTEDDDPVILILDGVNVTCSNSAPLFIANASCTVIDLLPGTENQFTDGASYTFENQDDDEPNACIFSKDDLTITGEGSLVIQGNYEDGIASKDGLVIRGGDLTIRAADDGIRGKDYLVIKGGSLVIDAGGDGLKSSNEEDSDCGYVYLASGTLQITAGGDAIHAMTDALVREAVMGVVTGGGAGAVQNNSTSAKGIKGLVYTVIDGGTFAMNTADDAVHSNQVMIINGGFFSIATGDDAFHADSLLVINDGKIGVTECYEGVESAVISVNGGELHLVSSDDGINVATGNDGSGTVPGRPPGGPGGDEFGSSGDYYFFMEDGYITVNSLGDGLDINGSVVMAGGTLIVDGPSSNMNGALDYDRSFAMNGGFLLGTGSSGMAQAPGTGSGQESILVNFSSSKQAGTLVHLESGSGSDLFTFSPSKTYQSVVFSSPDLESGTSYGIYYGGSTSGSFTDGLLVDGSYSPGTEYREFTISATTTLIR